MAKFLYVYRGGRNVYEQLAPEEKAQQMQRWQVWLGEGFQKGWLVDGGDGLKKERRVVNAKQLVTDGPFVESKEIVGGFSIVQADTIDAAAEIAKGCPVLRLGGSVEVGPLEGFVIAR
jgi:hypothetical protein